MNRLLVEVEKLKNKVKKLERDSEYSHNSQAVYLNTKWFGAVGDGTTDDLTAIQAAVDALDAAGGGILHFPKGTYIVSSYILLSGDDNIQIVGDGVGATTLKAGASSTQEVLIIQNSASILVRDLTVDCNSGATTDQSSQLNQQAISIISANSNGVTDCVIQNVRMTNGHQTGLTMTSSSTSNPLEVLVENCEIDNFGDIGIYVNGSQDPDQTGEHQIRINNNRIHDNAEEGIWVRDANGIIISNNHSYLNDDMGIAIRDCKGFRIVGNWCYDNDTGVSGFCWGIAVSVDTTDYVIGYNVCYGNYSGGITLDPHEGSNVYEETRATVVGNVVFDNPNNNGINLNYADLVTIVGNVSENNGLDGITVNGNDCVIAHNVITNNGGYGIDLDQASGSNGGNTIVGNTFSGNSGSPNVYDQQDGPNYILMDIKQTYTPTNVTTDRSYDANSTTLDEIADVLGTLIADLQAAGVVA